MHRRRPRTDWPRSSERQAGCHVPPGAGTTTRKVIDGPWLGGDPFQSRRTRLPSASPHRCRPRRSRGPFFTAWKVSSRSARSKSLWYDAASWTAISSAFPLIVSTTGFPVSFNCRRNSGVFRLKSVSGWMSWMRFSTASADHIDKALNSMLSVLASLGKRIGRDSLTRFRPRRLPSSLPAIDAYGSPHMAQDTSDAPLLTFAPRSEGELRELAEFRFAMFSKLLKFLRGRQDSRCGRSVL